ncbi:MAG: Gfo/Idh/MocA family oxidoreductase [Oscillospiraceae bacterium]|nr:Gfo/Idh/MocA family oxidoreductase [Oscillospiraceae bacterium]
MNTAIIGAGNIGRKHTQALLRIPGVSIAGVLDPNPENARSVADLCGARVIDDISDILGHVHMIHLLSPPSKRVEYAGAAMRAQKHVFCEKPLASTAADGEKLRDLAKENNVFFMTAFNMRFRPGYLALQKDVLSGRLGEIISVWSHRVGPGSGFNAPMGDSWRTEPGLVCGMTVESLSHDIDMFRGLGLEIESVAAWVKGSRADLPEFDNNAHLLMRLKNGGSAVINASWSSHLPMSSRGVIGTKGSAVLEGSGFFDFTTYRVVTDSGEETIQMNDPFDNESYYTENLHFIECVKTGKPPEINADSGLAALKVSLAALKSAETGSFVSI